MSIIPQFAKFDGGTLGIVMLCVKVFDPLAAIVLPKLYLSKVILFFFVSLRGDDE